MCGIVGISAETNVAAEIYDSLLMLQHRGQDSTGIATMDGSVFSAIKSMCCTTSGGNDTLQSQC